MNIQFIYSYVYELLVPVDASSPSATLSALDTNLNLQVLSPDPDPLLNSAKMRIRVFLNHYLISKPNGMACRIDDIPDYWMYAPCSRRGCLNHRACCCC
jgi:hypothetical protein